MSFIIRLNNNTTKVLLRLYFKIEFPLCLHEQEYETVWHVIHVLLCMVGTCSSPAVTTENSVTDEKKHQCAQLVQMVLSLLSKGITARQIMTKKVFSL